MNSDKKTADELLFEEQEPTPIFRSMVAEGILLNDIIQKDKV
jgi:hypothetical protein